MDTGITGFTFELSVGNVVVTLSVCWDNPYSKAFAGHLGDVCLFISLITASATIIISMYCHNKEHLFGATHANIHAEGIIIQKFANLING